MLNPRVIFFAAVVLFAGVAGVQWMNRRPARQSEAAPATVRLESVPLASEAPSVPPAEPTAEPTPATTVLLNAPEVRPTPQSKPALTLPQINSTAASPKRSRSAASAQAPKPKEPLRDPIAREALYFVGADPRAEAYWLEAINDPSLSAQEREDLIEDLNEDGLPDPKYPSEDDLPLIVRRLQLIEAVGEDAMDEANAAAFREAYKDLLNLAEVAMGGGRPVR